MRRIPPILLFVALVATLIPAEPDDAEAATYTDVTAMMEMLPAQRGCDIEEFRYQISATDGGNATQVMGDGGFRGGTVLANVGGDGLCRVY